MAGKKANTDSGAEETVRAEPSASGHGASESSDDAAPLASDDTPAFVDVTPEMLEAHSLEEQKEAIESYDAKINKGRFAELKAVIQQFKNTGEDYTQINDDLDEWKEIPINIAITGASGSGKSTFINSIRCITADNDGAAAVGSNETTMVCKGYPHPDHPNLVLWDLPGVGTPKFPKASYLENVGLDKYDFFLIVSHSRFSENDLWLAKEVSNKKKKFYFIRTKADMEEQNDRKAHPQTHNARQLITGIRTDCEQQLTCGGIANPDVFVINSYNKNKYDFEKLQLKLIEEAPKNKREAVVLSFSALTPGIIKEKKEVLAGRKWKVALIASVGSAVPIPGAGMTCEAVALLHEGRFYCKQLGMDENSISDMAKIMKRPVKTLKEQCQMELFQILTNAHTLLAYMGKRVASEALETAAKAFLPIIGIFISVAISYPCCAYTLQTLLDMCVKEALYTQQQFTTWLDSETQIDNEV